VLRQTCHLGGPIALARFARRDCIERSLPLGRRHDPNGVTATASGQLLNRNYLTQRRKGAKAKGLQMNGNSRSTALLPLQLQTIPAEFAADHHLAPRCRYPADDLASFRLCILAPLRQAVRSLFDLSVLDEGGTYREALQRRLASKDALDCHDTSARRH